MTLFLELPIQNHIDCLEKVFWYQRVGGLSGRQVTQFLNAHVIYKTHDCHNYWAYGKSRIRSDLSLVSNRTLEGATSSVGSNRGDIFLTLKTAGTKHLNAILVMKPIFASPDCPLPKASISVSKYSYAVRNALAWLRNASPIWVGTIPFRVRSNYAVPMPVSTSAKMREAAGCETLSVFDTNCIFPVWAILSIKFRWRGFKHWVKSLFQHTIFIMLRVIKRILLVWWINTFASTTRWLVWFRIVFLM